MRAFDLGTKAWKAMPDTLGRRLSYGTYTAPNHVRLVSWLLMLNSTGRVRRLGLSLPPGSGKALALDTPIPTPDGWTTMGELRPGDRVFDEQGCPCTVTAVSPVWRDRERYEVHTSDGDVIVADENHEWPLRLDIGTNTRNYTTQVLARPRKKRAMSTVAGALRLPPADLLVDPYVLGVWLGDGTTLQANVTAVDEDAKYLRAEIESRGYVTTDQQTVCLFGILGLRVKLRDLGVLGDKHVPAQYLRGSVEQRLDLLRGLIDTDGHVNPGGEVEFTSTCKPIADAVVELVRSLGRKAALREGRATLNGRDCGPKWRVTFYLAECALLPRKRMRTRDGVRTPNRYLTATPTSRGETVCISVDSSSHLFLAGRSMTPTHNSEIVDFYDSTWLLEHDPRRRIILASYSGDLAEEQGKRVRNLIESNPDLLRVRLMQDSRAADRWKTTMGGGMWTVGTGGSITGRRASNLKIDDPHKNFAEAMSVKNQIDTWNWYGSTARTRMLPRASLAVIQTRWAEGDLLGRLKAQDENRGEWLFVALPAIAEQTETIDTVLGDWAPRLRSQGLILPEWHREEGEALWPELEPGVPWFDEAEYADIRADVGEVVWAGLYQQRPAPVEGNLFHRAKWVRLDGALPIGKYIFVRRWDLASTEGAGDWTAGCLMALNTETRALYIVDMRRARLGPADVKAFVRATAEEDRDNWGNVLIRVEREPGSSGKNVELDYLQNVLDGLPAKFLPSTGDKSVRALPLSGQQGARNVHLCRRETADGWAVPDWWNWLIEESAIFPNGQHDDLVDVASLAYMDLVEESPRRGRGTVRSGARRSLGF